LKILEELYLGSVHLDHEFEEYRIAQIDALISYAVSQPLPATVVGDFNFEEGSEASSRIPSHWKETRKEAGNTDPTYPVEGEEGKRIDYLFYDSNCFQLVSYRVIPLPYSAHYAILVTLDLIKKMKDSASTKNRSSQSNWYRFISLPITRSEVWYINRIGSIHD
jgi:endonuclease/exonuclease/phosphatase family metal-dependent hydrolase